MDRPTEEELRTIQKGLRKRKLPRVFDGMWCSEPGIGGMKATASDLDLVIEWVSFEKGVKSGLKKANWKSLCTDSSLEFQRLEVGLVVAEVLLAQGRKVMDSVGHPTEAAKEAEPYLRAAEEWKHWAMVKAGHMTGV